MKFSVEWLKQYVEFSYSPQKLAQKLTMAGLEVEHLEEFHWERIVTGKVLGKEKLPNSDKLSLCSVNVGKGTGLRIVCGASNVEVGQMVAVALPGATLTGGLTIQKTNIRGVESEGMICAESELGLADKKSEGIWILTGELKPGIPLSKAMRSRGSAVLDLALTPNRPDCMSLVGIAREVSFLTRNPLRKPSPKVSEVKEDIRSFASVKVLTQKGCPRYAVRVIRNVKIGPSPEWLKNRLESVGIRSINNAVDITNYVLLETGHPLHAFDYNKLTEKKIIVRESEEGELFITLDGKKRELKKGTVLICDAEKAVAIGGIMGGMNSEISDSTTDILLESAYFTPSYISRSSRDLGLVSEASQRFARGADPNAVLWAMNRACELLVDLGNGNVVRGSIDIYPKKILPKKVKIRTERVNKILDIELTAIQIARILKDIEIQVKNEVATVPTFRPDIEREIDLIEEVARLHGYENIPTRDHAWLPYHLPENKTEGIIQKMKTALAELGLTETIALSMIDEKSAVLFEDQRKYIKIRNPLSDEYSVMRTSLIATILKTIRHNLNRKNLNLRLYELGNVYRNSEVKNTHPVEETFLVIALTGRSKPRHWSETAKQVDFYDLKAIVEQFLLKISLDKWAFIPYDTAVYNISSLSIFISDEVIGNFGLLKPGLLKNWDIGQPVWLCELNVNKLIRFLQDHKTYRPVPKFPAVERDVALVVGKAKSSYQVCEAVYKGGGHLLRSIEIFDVYKGEQIGPDQKSLALSLKFYSTERTLTDEEVNQVIENILKVANLDLGATLRS